MDDSTTTYLVNGAHSQSHFSLAILAEQKFPNTLFDLSPFQAHMIAGDGSNLALARCSIMWHHLLVLKRNNCFLYTVINMGHYVKLITGWLQNVNYHKVSKIREVKATYGCKISDRISFRNEPITNKKRRDGDGEKDVGRDTN